MAKDDQQMARAAELFEREDEAFVDALRAVHSFDLLSAFADRWKTDSRVWARQQILVYLSQPMNSPGHQTVVKRLFKHAEESGDDQVMAAFLVAFDRLVRRQRKTRGQWDWETRSYSTAQVLVTPRNSLPLEAVRSPNRFRDRFRLFSYHTRYYLRRRAWRYFRRAGFQRPGDYVSAIAHALVRYSDEDLQTGENILDCWGLVHACFQRHPAFYFGSSRIEINDGFSLSDVSAAPQFPELWQAESAADVLMRILREAQSHLVRVWSLDLLRAHHARRLATIEITALVELLNHANAEVQHFGAELLENHQALDRLPVEMWLRLLQVKNLTVLETICQVMGRHVSADRLTLEECLQLTCVEETSVAQLGFDFLQTRTIETETDRTLLRRLGGAQCDAIGGELAQWALDIAGAEQVYNVETVCYFFDSLLKSIRDASWDWLVTPSRGYQDPVLWSRILETPFDDLRLRVIEELERRTKLPGVSDEDLTPVWCSVLVGVHRGGRQKAKAVRQIGDALSQNPDRADELLPVLVVAVRSIRRPEFRAGLATVVSTLMQHPELSVAVQQFIPELMVNVEEPAG